MQRESDAIRCIFFILYVKIGIKSSHSGSRCVDAEAFEVNKDDLSNGIFMSFLKKRLMEPEKVTVILDKVAEGLVLKIFSCFTQVMCN